MPKFKSNGSVVGNLFNFRFYERSLNNFITSNANHDKFIMKLRAKLAYFFHYNDYWLTFLHLVIFINIVLLSLDSYPITNSRKEILELLELIIFFIYFLEICVKLIAFGPILFFKSGFNLIDFLIVMLNALEYIYQGIKMNDEDNITNTFAHFLLTYSFFGNFIKTFKVLRLFRSMFYSDLFKTFALLLNGLVSSLFQLRYFMVILLSFVVLTSLIGTEIFAYKFRLKEEAGPHLAHGDEHGFQPKINFDTAGDSLIAIITALYNEEWHIVMFQHYIGVGYKTLLFYYPLIILGLMTFMTLFAALFINSFMKSIKQKMMNVDNFQNISLKNFKIIMTGYVKNMTIFINGENLPKISAQSETRRSALFENTFKSSHYLKRVRNSRFQKNSLLPILPQTNINVKKTSPSSRDEIKRPDEKKAEMSGFSEVVNEETEFFYTNGVAQFIGEILSNHYFENFMIVMTVTSMIVIALDSPIKDPNSNEIKTLNILEFLFVAIYCLEFILKILIFGVFKGKRSYFQESFFHFLDFLNVILSFAALFEDKQISRNLHMCKIIRCFRVIKWARHVNKDMQILSTALVHAFPNIIKLLLFFLVFIFIFSIFAMKYLKGLLFKCIDVSLEEKEIEELIHSKIDCFDYGGNWVNHDLNYDNIINAFFSLFQIVSGEGWSFLM